MAAIIRTEWTGTSGGPGLTQFAISGGIGEVFDAASLQPCVDAVRAFWNAIKANLPDELNLQVSPVVDVFDSNTGVLIASYVVATTPAVVVGGSSLSYAGGVGMKIVWNTGEIAFGRRVRGATYIVPAASGVYTGTGTINSTIAGEVNTAATTMIAALMTATHPLVVWSRPKVAPVARPGNHYNVISGSVGTKTAILRGRRD